MGMSIKEKVIFLMSFWAIGSFVLLNDASAELLQPEDLVYEGGFKLPGPNGMAKWSYGGMTLTYNPEGDPNGPADGYPGSLFSVGRPEVYASEISIPPPSKSLNSMNTAMTLQPFGDITGGLVDRAIDEYKEVRGLAYLEAQPGQSGSKLYWTVWNWYNVDDSNDLSHGWSDLDISHPNAQGVWRLGDYHSKMTAGYIFDVPRDWADRNLGGRYLISGGSREGGGFGRGPLLYAFSPYQYDNGNPPPYGATLDAVPLLVYEGDHEYPGYGKCDEWRGASWLTSGNKQAIVFLGVKGTSSYCYGVCSDPCSSSKGYHCNPYQPQMLFYDPDDLLKVAKGELQPWEPLPYRVVDLSSFFYTSCRNVEGAAFDRERGILYVIEKRADMRGQDPYPVIHVFKIEGGSQNQDASAPEPPKALRVR